MRRLLATKRSLRDRPFQTCDPGKPGNQEEITPSDSRPKPILHYRPSMQVDRNAELLHLSGDRTCAATTPIIFEALVSRPFGRAHQGPRHRDDQVACRHSWSRRSSPIQQCEQPVTAVTSEIADDCLASAPLSHLTLPHTQPDTWARTNERRSHGNSRIAGRASPCRISLLPESAWATAPTRGCPSSGFKC